MAEYEIEFRCKHCGKPISILHPSQWGYKVRNKKGGWTYYCTWKCLRADERKEPKPVQAARKRWACWICGRDTAEKEWTG